MKNIKCPIVLQNSVPFAKYRGVGLALLICFLEFWSGVIIFALFFLNVLSALW